MPTEWWEVLWMVGNAQYHYIVTDDSWCRSLQVAQHWHLQQQPVRGMQLHTVV
jgi:hypothetical protein